MQDLKIELPDEIIRIRCVSASNLQAFSAMVSDLQALWLKHGASTGELILSSEFKLAKDLVQKLADLHPRLDKPGTLGFNTESLWDDREQLESLFFMQRSDEDRLDISRGSLLMRLNHLDPGKKLEEAQAALEKLKVSSPPESTGVPTSPPTSPDTLEITEAPAKSSRRRDSAGLKDSSIDMSQAA